MLSRSSIRTQGRALTLPCIITHTLIIITSILNKTVPALSNQTSSHCTSNSHCVSSHVAPALQVLDLTGALTLPMHGLKRGKTLYMHTPPLPSPWYPLLDPSLWSFAARVSRSTPPDEKTVGARLWKILRAMRDREKDWERGSGKDWEIGDGGDGVRESGCMRTGEKRGKMGIYGEGEEKWLSVCERETGRCSLIIETRTFFRMRFDDFTLCIILAGNKASSLSIILHLTAGQYLWGSCPIRPESRCLWLDAAAAMRREEESKGIKDKGN
jgi:hypothetical protein